MKYFYIAAFSEQNRKESIFNNTENCDNEPGYYAFVIKCTDCDNLLSVLNGYGGIQAANIMPTKKHAEEVVAKWNESFKKNGTYYFG